MSTFTELAMVKGMPRRLATIDQVSAERVIASRVLNGWPVRHEFLVCRDGSTVCLVWFLDTVGQGYVWSVLFETEGW